MTQLRTSRQTLSAIMSYFVGVDQFSLKRKEKKGDKFQRTSFKIADKVLNYRSHFEKFLAFFQQRGLFVYKVCQFRNWFHLIPRYILKLFSLNVICLEETGFCLLRKFLHRILLISKLLLLYFILFGIFFQCFVFFLNMLSMLFHQIPNISYRYFMNPFFRHSFTDT